MHSKTHKTWFTWILSRVKKSLNYLIKDFFVLYFCRRLFFFTEVWRKSRVWLWNIHFWVVVVRSALLAKLCVITVENKATTVDRFYYVSFQKNPNNDGVEASEKHVDKFRCFIKSFLWFFFPEICGKSFGFDNFFFNFNSGSEKMFYFFCSCFRCFWLFV